MLGRVADDIKSFIGGKDLVVFAIGLALSSQFQATIGTLIDSLIMPFISSLTGATRLDNRSVQLGKPLPNGDPIRLFWGRALKSIIVFMITLVIMVEIARYLTVNFVSSSTVTFR
jgi:large-conductance mechanosensitive channel